MTITVYSKPQCPQCSATMKRLDKLDADFQVLDAREHLDTLKELGFHQAPVVVPESGTTDAWSGFRLDKITSAVEAQRSTPESSTSSHQSEAVVEESPTGTETPAELNSENSRPFTGYDPTGVLADTFCFSIDDALNNPDIVNAPSGDLDNNPTVNPSPAVEAEGGVSF